MLTKCWVCFVCVLSVTSVGQTGEMQQDPDADRRWSTTWASYWGEDKQDGDAGASGVTSTIQANTVTLEKRVFDNFSIGLDLTYETQNQVQDEVPAGFTQAGRLSQQSYEANFFGNFTHGIFSIEPNVRVGLDDYELERPDTLTNTGLIGRSQTNGHHLGFNVEAAITVPINSYIFLRPTVNYDFEFVTADPFKEVGVSIGPNNFNISFDRVEDKRSIGEAGIGLAAKIPIEGFGTLTPFVVGKYRRNFITGPVTAHASTSTTALGEITLANGQEKEGFMFDAGMFLTSQKNMEIWAVYRGQYFPSSTRHGVAGQIKINF